MKSNNNNRGILHTLKTPALIMALSALAQLAASAATINFNSPVTCAGDADVLALGQPAYAYDWGTSSTINGVAFTATAALGTVGGGNVTLVNFGSALAANFAGTVPPFTSLSTAYTNLLKGAVFTNTTTVPTTGTVTLNNLAAGHKYALQVWANDSRGTTFSNRTEWIYDGSGGATNTLALNTTKTNGGVGQYILGTFISDGSPQSFVLDNSAPGNPNANNLVQLNGLQLRDVSSVWSGTTSGTWADSDTTSANFSGFSYSAALALGGMTNAYFGDVDGSGNAVARTTITVGTGGASGMNAVFVNKALAYTVNSADATGITGSVDVRLNGTNTVTFTGAHTYTGSTVLGSTARLTIGASGSIASSASTTLGANSILTLGNSAALAGSSTIALGAGSLLDASSTSLSLGSSQTLSGAGMVNGNVTAASGATIVPGSVGTPGVLTFNSNLTLNGQPLVLDVGYAPSSSGDRMDVGGVLTLNGNTVISLNYLGGTPYGGTYTLMTFASKSGGTLTLDQSYPGVTLNVNATSVTLTITGGSGGTSGVWTNLAGGSWITAANWQGGVIATNTDALADFSSLDITAARTVTVNSTNINIGHMVFGDTVQDFNWTLSTGTNTLAVSSGSPRIVVYPGQNTTISSVLRGTQGFTKLGAGTLTLSGANVMSGGINVYAGTLVGTAAGSFGSSTAATANPITLSNASLTISAALANNAWTNNVIFLGTSNTITAGAATPGFRGTTGGSSVFSGSSTVALNCAGNTPALSGHMDGFTGTLIINATAAGGLLMGHNQDSGFYPGADGITGSSSAVFDFEGGGVNYMYNGAMPATNYLGELRGNSAAVLWAKNGRSGDVTLEIGGLGTSSEFAGAFRDNRAGASPYTPINIRKVGAGTLTLSGTSINTGPTDVRGGKLLVTGTLGVTPVTVQSGATLEIDGTVSSPTITVNSNGKFVLGAGAGLGSAVITMNGLMDVTAAGGSFYLGSATLTGSGVVTGAVTLATASLNPGSVGGAGTLTITNGGFTASGGTLQFDLSSTPASGNDFLDVNGDMDFSTPGITISINKISGSLGAGTYVLAKCSGALSGSVGNLTLVGANPLDVLQLSGKQLQLVVSAVTTLTWTGNGAGNLWDIGASTTWLNVATPSTYADGNAVIFNNTGGTNPVVNIPATVAPAIITVASSSNYTFTGAGDISGGASLIKSGTGTLTVLNTNTFIGNIFVNAGTLAVGNAGTNGQLSANITNNGALVYTTPLDQVLTNSLTGPGTFAKLGAGQLTFTADSTVSGPTTISSGILSLGDGSSTAGSLGTGNVTNNAALAINRATAFTMSNAVRNNGGIINIAAGPVTLSGAISGTGSLTNDYGAGVLNLAGNNSYSGGTTISGGKVMLQNFAGFGSGSVNIDDSGSGELHFAPALGVTNVLSNNIKLPLGTQQQFMMDGTSLGVRTTVRLTGVLSGGATGSPTIFVDSGVTANTRGVLVLDNPANTFTTIPEVFRGTLAFTSDGALGNSANGIRVNSRAQWQLATFDVNQQGLRFDANGITLNASRSIELVSDENIDVQNFSATIAGPITGTGLIKLGSGTLTLNGGGSLTNSTTVAGGTLLLNNAWTGNSVTVNSGATLGGVGSIAAPVTVQSGGTLAPGASIGTLTVSSNVTLAAGSTTAMEINAGSLTSDKLVCQSALSYGGTLAVTNVGGTLAAGQSFQLFSGASSGNFAATNLPALSGLAWNWNPANGTLSVVSGGIATNPTNITMVVSGGNLNLSWPADHTGWRLEVQTNAATTGLNTNWSTYPGSTSVNSISIPINPANGSVFFRMAYP